MSDIASLFHDLPDGIVWVKGSWLKELGRKIIEDRAILIPPSGDEVPTPDGRQFRIAFPTQAPDYFPFEIVDNKDGTISIIYGTLNDTTPSVSGGGSSDNAPAEAIGTMGAGNFTLYLNGELSDDGKYNVISSSIDTSPPSEMDSRTTCSTIIGVVSVSGSTVTIMQNIKHSQWFVRCKDKGDQFGAR